MTTPYPGLRPFKSHESHLFFGRDEFITQLTEKLNSHYFISVVGDSGCGKSSLVRAGLLARLLVVGADGRDFWRIATMRPGSQPFSNIAAALLNKKTSHTGGEEFVLREEYLKKHPLEEKQSVAHLAQSLRKDLKISYQELEILLPANHSLLIVVDQFEELFHHAEKGIQQKEEVVDFIQWLLATAHAESKIYVVITMRADHLEECAAHDDLIETINDGFFQIPHLNREQLKETIELPARMYEGEVEPRLVERLLDHLEELGTDCRPDHLPLLQYVLVQMWLRMDTEPKKLTLEHYAEIGGNLAAALTWMADQTYNGSTDDEKKIVEILFRRLTQKEGTHYIRHPVQLVVSVTSFGSY